jgi:S1-C subfamily serine protease
MNLSPAVAQELGLDGLPEGVIIAEVRRGGQADRVGLRPGDIVRAINNQSIDSTRMLETITKTPPRIWRLDIERDGKVSQIVLR